MEIFSAFAISLQSVWLDSGFSALTMGNVAMIIVGIFLLYMAIGKEYEPLLLTPIAFGCIMANFPCTGFLEEPGVMQVINYGIKFEIFPPLIFLGVGAMTDFGPLLANPNTLFLGAAAQFGVFISLAGAMLLGFTAQEASAIGIIGGADGPLIQPPIMKALTTQKEREIKMDQLRNVTHFEKMVFPVASAILISLLLPPVAALISMLMLGNLFRESGVTDRLSDTSQNALCNIVTIFLATGTGMTMNAEDFLTVQTLMIIGLGLLAFAGGTAAGVILGKVMCRLSGWKINPLIGSAGVSAVPMAARVSQVVGQKANPSNFLLMHAMGPNVAGVIGTAVAAGTMLAMLGAK